MLGTKEHRVGSPHLFLIIAQSCTLWASVCRQTEKQLVEDLREASLRLGIVSAGSRRLAFRRRCEIVPKTKALLNSVSPLPQRII